MLSEFKNGYLRLYPTTLKEFTDALLFREVSHLTPIIIFRPLDVLEQERLKLTDDTITQQASRAYLE